MHQPKPGNGVSNTIINTVTVCEHAVPPAWRFWRVPARCFRELCPGRLLHEEGPDTLPGGSPPPHPAHAARHRAAARCLPHSASSSAPPLTASPQLDSTKGKCGDNKILVAEQSQLTSYMLTSLSSDHLTFG